MFSSKIFPLLIRHPKQTFMNSSRSIAQTQSINRQNASLSIHFFCVAFNQMIKTKY